MLQLSLSCDDKKSDVSYTVASKGNSHRDIPLDVEINCRGNVAHSADGYADEAHQILPVGIFVNLRFLVLRNVRRSEFQAQIFLPLLADLLPDGDLVIFPVNSYWPTKLGCGRIVGITDECRSAVVFLLFAHLLLDFFFIGF